ncbi:MAG: hypothetical protein ABI237_14555 [Ginsengibacter sp.]
MSQKRKSTAPLLLAGIAAFAYYKYSKLTPEQKKDLGGTIKEKGKKIYDKYVPHSVKNLFGKDEDEAEYADI